MEEAIKKIVEDFAGQLDDNTRRKVLNMLTRNEEMLIEYSKSQDSLGVIYMADCPACGGSLKFQRYSDIVAPHNYCHHCGQKLLKQNEKE